MMNRYLIKTHLASLIILISCGVSRASENKEKRTIVVIGPEGSGKSTAIAYLEGKTIKKIEDEDGDEKLEISDQPSPPSSNFSFIEKVKIDDEVRNKSVSGIVIITPLSSLDSGANLFVEQIKDILVSFEDTFFEDYKKDAPIYWVITRIDGDQEEVNTKRVNKFYKDARRLLNSIKKLHANNPNIDIKTKENYVSWMRFCNCIFKEDISKEGDIDYKKPFEESEEDKIIMLNLFTEESKNKLLKVIGNSSETIQKYLKKPAQPDLSKDMGGADSNLSAKLGQDGMSSLSPDSNGNANRATREQSSQIGTKSGQGSQVDIQSTQSSQIDSNPGQNSQADSKHEQDSETDSKTEEISSNSSYNASGYLLIPIVGIVITAFYMVLGGSRHSPAKKKKAKKDGLSQTFKLEESGLSVKV